MATTAPSLRWRVIDIVTAAVLGVACGLIFVAWNQVGDAGYEFLKTIAPRRRRPRHGRLAAGRHARRLRHPQARRRVLRRADGGDRLHGPGLAVGHRDHLLGSRAGPRCGGRLRPGRLPPLQRDDRCAAGAVSFAFEWVLELFLAGHLAKGVLYNVIYLVCGMASGIVLAGLLAWALTNALAKTGALDRFASGRGARELV